MTEIILPSQTVPAYATLSAFPLSASDGALAVAKDTDTVYVFNAPSHTWVPVSGGSGGSGTVTSVALTAPSIFSVSGSPVTTAGTLAIALTTETANQVFAGPTSGGAATPTFRNIVSADLPAGITPAQTPTQNQIYYVNGNAGDDVNGDGTYNKPFATIMHAMGLITTANASNRFIIKILGSKLQEPTNIVLKGYVYIVGDHLDGTYIRINGGAGSITPDPATTISTRCGLQNIYLGGGTSINWDLFDNGPNTGTPSCLLVLDGVTVTGNFTYKGRTPTIDFLEIYDSYIFGTTLLDACQANSFTTTFQGAVTISTVNGGGNSLFQADSFLSGVTVSAPGTYTNVVQLVASPTTGTLTLTDSASLITFVSDVASYPLHANVAITGTPTVTFSNDAYGLEYTPTTSGNWSPVPASVQAALDTLAAKPTGSAYAVNEYTLSPTDITNKFVTLSVTPAHPTLTVLNVIGGPVQSYTSDFTVSGSTLSWSGLFLDGVLVSGDKLIVQFY